MPKKVDPLGPFFGTPIDMAVIGAGPAGLSCAIRGRFIKSRGAYPMSVAIFEASGACGGLATLGNVKITGPGFSMPGREFVDKLLADVEDLDIPVIYDAVVSVSRRDDDPELFTMTTLSGKSYAARSVVVCAGMRKLSNEREYFGRGLSVTYMGYDHIARTVIDSISAARQGGFMIYGNKHSINLIDLVLEGFSRARIDPDKYGPVFLIDGSAKDLSSASVYKRHSNLFSFGRIERFLGKGRLEAAICVRGAKRVEVPVRRLLLDYNSFEIEPAIDIELPSNMRLFTRHGYMRPVPPLANGHRGIAAAGDATGPYYCVARAMSSGIEAAFATYLRVSAQKGLRRPSLFAYRALNASVPASYREVDPGFVAGRDLLVLSGSDKVASFIRGRFPGIGAGQLKSLLKYARLYYIIDGDSRLAMSRLLGIGDDDLAALSADMIDAKLVTVV